MSKEGPSDHRVRPLAAVQALRALAAVLVLIGHTLEETQVRFHADFHTLLQLSWLSGVDIFFVISGFIMVTTSWNRFATPGAPRLFLLHRLVRVVPLYWIFTTLIVLTMLGSASALGVTKFDPAQIATSYVFWPFRRYDGAIQPALSVGWTLNYEMFFYAIFASTLLLHRRFGLALLFTALIGLPILGALLRPAAAPLEFWTDPIIIEFAFGAIVGILFMQGPRWKLRPAIAITAALASIALFMVMHPLADMLGLHLPRFIGNGLIAALVVLFCTVTLPERADARTPRLLQMVGDASYSLYLSHRFGLRIASLFLGKLVIAGLIGPWLFVAGTVIVCVLLGQIVHIYCERPVTRICQRLMGVRVKVDQKDSGNAVPA